MVLVEVTPAKIIWNNDDEVDLAFSMNVSNKTPKSIYFYPRLLNVSRFNHPATLIYIDSFVSYSKFMYVIIKPIKTTTRLNGTQITRHYDTDYHGF